MKRFRYIFALAALAVSLAGCKEDKLDTYSGSNNIYFAFAATESSDADAKDSMDVSMANALTGVILEDSIIGIPVQISGPTVNYARSFKAMGVPKVVYERATAVEGSDYEILPSEIPAGEVTGMLRIKLKRTTKLDDASATPDPDTKEIGLRFKVQLMANENFGIDMWQLSDMGAYTDPERSKYGMNGVSFKVSYQNAVGSSELWTNAVSRSTMINYFGEFSVAKVNYLAEWSGFPFEMWFPNQEYLSAWANSYMGYPLPGTPAWDALTPARQNSYRMAPWQMYGSYLLGMDKTGNPGSMTYMVLRVGNVKLKEARDAGQPLLDEKGNEITLGSRAEGYI